MRVLVLVAVALAARDARAESQVWSAAFVQARAADTGPTGWLDLHIRRRGDGTLGIVRPAIGYTFSSALAAHVGYAWVPIVTDEGPNKVDHRIWQQVIVNHVLGPNVKLQGRARLEQRWGAGDDIAHRLRILVRGQWAVFGSVPLQLVTWDELFLNFVETDWAGPAGYDQNRAFVGLGADTAVRGVRVEAGYVNVVLRTDLRVDHVLGINVIATVAP